MTKQEDKALRACGQVIGIISACGLPTICATPGLNSAYLTLLADAMDALSELLDDNGDLVLSEVTE